MAETDIPSPDRLEADGWTRHEATGFLELVGPLWEKYDGELFRLAFVAADKHHNRRGIVQGGMIATLADRGMGLSVRAVNNDGPQSTVQLDLHYLDASQVGEFIEARSRVVRLTRYIAFVECVVVSAGREVATAKGIWRLLGAGSASPAPRR